MTESIWMCETILRRKKKHLQGFILHTIYSAIAFDEMMIQRGFDEMTIESQCDREQRYKNRTVTNFSTRNIKKIYG